MINENPSREVRSERVLYGFWLSPFMSLVAHMMSEAGLPYRYQRVSPFIDETLAADHRLRNPLGKIPSLEDETGSVVSESQAICRYLARTYPAAEAFYPASDAQLCAQVDEINDFISFSISGPFFNWFMVNGYYTHAFDFKTEKESKIFGEWSFLLIKNALMRLNNRAKFTPYLLGEEPCLADFHLFHVVELSKTFAQLFNIPFMNLLGGEPKLKAFYEAMLARESTQEILQLQAQEFAKTKQEILEQFGPTYKSFLKPAKMALSMMFGHEV